MAVITSRTQLRDYCLRECGQPLVKVNIHQDQLDDALDDAIQYFQEYHNEGQERTFISLEVTQQHLDQKYFILPEEVFAVVQVLNTSLYANISSFMTPQFELLRNITFEAARGAAGVSDLVVTRQYLADIEAMLAPVPQFTYRHSTGRLQIFDNIGKNMNPGQFIVYEAYVIVDPEVNTRLWRNRLLRKLAAAYVMRQYATNLTKYDSVQLPSGITVNSGQLKAIADERAQEAEAELMENGEPLGMIYR